MGTFIRGETPTLELTLSDGAKYEDMGTVFYRFRPARCIGGDTL